MMRQVEQSSAEAGPPLSPRGSSSSDTPKLSLLGQQLSYSAQQHCRNPRQHQQNPQDNANMSFSQPQSQTRSLSQSQQPVVGGDGAGRISCLQTVNSHVGAGQAFNPNGQLMNHHVFQVGSGADVLNACQQQEALTNILKALMQNIQQLLPMVPLLTQNPALTNPLGLHQAAAVAGAARMLSQLVETLSILPQLQQQSIDDSSQQLPQLLEPCVSTGFNLFQPQSGSSCTDNAAGDSVENHNFSFLQGAAGRVNAGPGAAGDSFVNQLNGVVEGNPSSTNSGSGLGVACAGAEAFGGRQQGEEKVGSEMGFRNSGRAIHNLHTLNQVGDGITRVGAVSSKGGSSTITAGMSTSSLEDHDVGGARAEDEDGEIENLPSGSYELVEMEAVDILAEHTHFCEICGKGFKRDANLRMHMRGHGDEYKTPAALARPEKASQDMSVVRPRRFSCPYPGCKRNKKHGKFQPLKTMLCVKNHYRRSHCPKGLTCQKCKTKRFSVVADLKTHEKHCGCENWQCSCGTTFSRKDKLYGHVGLFPGHTPVLRPFTELEASGTMHVSDIGGNPSGNDGSLVDVELPNDAKVNSEGSGAASVVLGGGIGMGLAASGFEGLVARGLANDKLGCPKEIVRQENSGSSYLQTGTLPPRASSRLEGLGLFSSNFLRTTNGRISSPVGLH